MDLAREPLTYDLQLTPPLGITLDTACEPVSLHR
jgi:hypothetical protein